MKTIHMSIDISGVLKWPDNKLRRLFKDEFGHKQSGSYVRDWLKLQLAHGKKVLPMCDDCEGFDYVTGCPGHEQNPPDQSRKASTESTSSANVGGNSR